MNIYRLDMLCINDPSSFWYLYHLCCLLLDGCRMLRFSYPSQIGSSWRWTSLCHPLLLASSCESRSIRLLCGQFLGRNHSPLEMSSHGYFPEFRHQKATGRNFHSWSARQQCGKPFRYPGLLNNYYFIDCLWVFGKDIVKCFLQVIFLRWEIFIVDLNFIYKSFCYDLASPFIEVNGLNWNIYTFVLSVTCLL